MGESETEFPQQTIQLLSAPINGTINGANKGPAMALETSSIEETATIVCLSNCYRYVFMSTNDFRFCYGNEVRRFLHYQLCIWKAWNTKSNVMAMEIERKAIKCILSVFIYSTSRYRIMFHAFLH